MHLTQNSQVVGVDGNTLTLGFDNAGARDSFVNGGCDEILRQAAIDVVGADWRVDTIVDPGAQADPAPAAPGQRPPRPTPSRPADCRGTLGAARLGRPTSRLPTPHAAPEPSPDPSPPRARAADRRPAVDRGRARARSSRPVRGLGESAADDSGPRPTPTPTPTTPTPTTSGLGSAELLERELGAQMIEEIRHP